MDITNPELWNGISQYGVLLSAPGTFLTARKNKWGWIVGLSAQPFWFITAGVNHQPGVIANTVIFTFIWIYGAWNWFRKDKRHAKHS